MVKFNVLYVVGFSMKKWRTQRGPNFQNSSRKKKFVAMKKPTFSDTNTKAKNFPAPPNLNETLSSMLKQSKDDWEHVNDKGKS